MARKKTADEKKLPMVVYGVLHDDRVELIDHPEDLWDYGPGMTVALYRREVVGKITKPDTIPVDFKLRP